MSLDIHEAARLIASIRTHTAQHSGCREWDTAGIAKALASTVGPPGAVLASAALAAEDASLDKPSEAAFRNHWPTKASTPPKVSHNVPCPDHPGRVMPCDLCREGKRPPTPDELGAAKAVVAEAVRTAREYHAEMQRLRAERRAEA